MFIQSFNNIYNLSCIYFIYSDALSLIIEFIHNVVLSKSPFLY